MFAVVSRLLLIFAAVTAISPSLARSVEPQVGGLSLLEARVCITGHDHNRPDPFPGLGDFIGWVGGINRLSNGDLLCVHSAGYWHVSFATPVLLNERLVESYVKAGFNPDHHAPTGGRIMACRSRDNGRTWGKPETIYEGKLDCRPSTSFVTRHGTVVVIVNMQASWYGFPRAPKGRQKLNTRQLVIRSTDDGHSWSDAKPLHSFGTYYTRGHSRGLELPDGSLLWASYDMHEDSSVLDGTIHRSVDDGVSWDIHSTIRRRRPLDGAVKQPDLVVSGPPETLRALPRPNTETWVDTDEGDLGRLSDGRLVLIVRPDGGVLISEDNGLTWGQIGVVGPEYLYAPSLLVLADDTLVLTAGGSGGQCIYLSIDAGRTWSKPFRLDPAVYGYGVLTALADGSILLGYVERHSVPQRLLLLRFRIDSNRRQIDLLAIGD